MSPNTLSFACGLYEHIKPLATGEVEVTGLDLKFTEVSKPRDLFDRVVSNGTFDAAEFSSSEYICRYAAGDRSLIGLPVFPLRKFRHGYIVVNKDRIKQPKDMEGKRIGVQLYTMTAAVWIRGLLEHEYSVDMSNIEWVEGSMESAGPHGKPSAMPILKPVNITTNSTSRSLSQLLEDGEIDATIGAVVPGCLGSAPHIDRLFPNFTESEKSYFEETEIFPIMHLVVMRRSYHEQNKEAAKVLFEALNESRHVALQRARGGDPRRDHLALLEQSLQDGVTANQKTLEALIRYLKDQSMIEKEMSVEELFVLA